MAHPGATHEESVRPGGIAGKVENRAHPYRKPKANGTLRYYHE